MSNQADPNPPALPIEATPVWEADGSALCLYKGSGSENLGAWPVPRRGLMGRRQEDARGSVREGGRRGYVCVQWSPTTGLQLGGVWSNF